MTLRNTALSDDQPQKTPHGMTPFTWNIQSREIGWNKAQIGGGPGLGVFKLNMIVKAKTITVNRKKQSPMVKEKIKLAKH